MFVVKIFFPFSLITNMWVPYSPVLQLKSSRPEGS
jgi:hypothetical protein